MHPRIKKLIGGVIFVAFTVCYFLIFVTIALVRLPGTPLLVQLGWYAAATLVWFFIAALLIYWMQTPPAAKSANLSGASGNGKK